MFSPTLSDTLFDHLAFLDKVGILFSLHHVGSSFVFSPFFSTFCRIFKNTFNNSHGLDSNLHLHFFLPPCTLTYLIHPSPLSQNLGLVSFLSTTSPFDAVLESFFKFQDLFFTHVVFCTLAHFFPLLNVSHSRLSSTPFLLSSHATPLRSLSPSLSLSAERSGEGKGVNVSSFCRSAERTPCNLEKRNKNQKKII